MATEIKLRRGTKAQHDDGAGFTGAEGEVTVDTTDNTLRVHDGSLKGGHAIAKVAQLQALDPTALVIAQTVSGVLTAGASINQFRDSGSFTMPPASSSIANHTLVAELPEKFAYNTPTITASGSDVFRISTGTDTVISFNSPARLTFTSDGVSEWSL